MIVTIEGGVLEQIVNHLRDDSNSFIFRTPVDSKVVAVLSLLVVFTSACVVVSELQAFHSPTG